MGYARIFARAGSNPGPPDYSFDDINIMPFITLLSAQIAEWYAQMPFTTLLSAQIAEW